MKKSILYILLISVPIFIFLQSNFKTSRIKCIRFYDEFPMIGHDGKLSHYLYDSISIFYYNQDVLYQFPMVVSNDSIINFQPNISEIEYEYFVYRQGEKQGYFFPAFDSSSKGWKSIDSILKRQSFYLNSIHFYDVFETSYVKLISSKSEGGNLEEIFKTVNRQDTSIKSTIHLRFSKNFENVDFTLSPHLDSIKNLKLFELTVINHPKYLPAHKIFVEEFKYKTSIKEVTLENEDLPIKYFEKFEKLRLEK